MPETEHDQLRSIAETLTGLTMPGKTSSHYLTLIEQNIGQNTTEATGSNYTITDPDLDYLAVDTSDGPVTVTLDPSFYSNGNTISISDVSNNAGTNNITIETGDSTMINGASSLVIDVNGGAVKLQYTTGLLSGGPMLDVISTVGAIL